MGGVGGGKEITEFAGSKFALGKRLSITSPRHAFPGQSSRLAHKPRDCRESGIPPADSSGDTGYLALGEPGLWGRPPISGSPCRGEPQVFEPCRGECREASPSSPSFDVGTALHPMILSLPESGCAILPSLWRNALKGLGTAGQVIGAAVLGVHVPGEVPQTMALSESMD